MKYDEVKSLLFLGKIEHTGINQIRNQYWPDHPNYDSARAESPWWAVQVPSGTITIGWRKRVIYIDGSSTNRRGLVTEDDVTKDDTMVHAWSYPAALEYLRKWNELPVVDVAIPGMKNYNIEGREEVLNALKMLGNGSVEVDLMMSMVKEAKLGWTTVMTISRRGDSGNTFHLRCGKLSVTHYQPLSEDD